jgi:hypothetical protein
MTRTRSSAKAAGTRFERITADYLARHVSEFIDRRAKTGSKDRGDHAGVRCHGLRGVHECKDRARVDMAGALAEAEIQRGNDDALWAAVLHKRHGRGDPGDQLVTMTLRDYAALLSGSRPVVEDTAVTTRKEQR